MELTKEDLSILLQLINAANIPGSAVERIVQLKQKLVMMAKPQPEVSAAEPQ